MRELARFLRRYALPYWPWFLAGFAFLLATNWLSVRIPLEMAAGIDALRAGDDPAGVRRAVLRIAAMGAGVIVVRTASRLFYFTPGRMVEYRFKNDLFEHLLALPEAQRRRWEAGDIVSRATSDITFLRVMVGFGSLQVCNIAMALAMGGGALFSLSPRLTGLVAIPIALGFLLVQVGIYRLFQLTLQNQAHLASISSAVLSSLKGLPTIQGMVAEEPFIRRFEERNDAWLETASRLARIQALFMPVLPAAGGIATWLLIAVGGPMVHRGELSVGELVACASYVAFLVLPMRSLGWLLNIFQRGLAALRRLGELLDAPAEPRGGRPLPAGPPSIEVRDLTFRWPGSDRPALEGVSFHLPAGGTLGIYGRTGAGKSTLLQLLARSWDPPRGTVRVAGIDVLDLDLASFRARMAYVDQRPLLFSETLAWNVLLGRDDPERLRTALREACLEEDIERLPDGVDTLVGEQGVMLSGGQKQRVALARALARDFDLLLLDDVLSAVDHATERALVEVIRRRTGPGRATAVLVSHRISALAHADLILVLDCGRVVDQGTHEELVSRPGPYREGWLHQNGEAA